MLEESRLKSEKVKEELAQNIRSIIPILQKMQEAPKPTKCLVKNRWIVFIISIISITMSIISSRLNMPATTQYYSSVAIYFLGIFFLICAIDKYEIFEVKK